MIFFSQNLLIKLINYGKSQCQNFIFNFIFFSIFNYFFRMLFLAKFNFGWVKNLEQLSELSFRGHPHKWHHENIDVLYLGSGTLKLLRYLVSTQKGSKTFLCRDPALWYFSSIMMSFVDHPSLYTNFSYFLSRFFFFFKPISSSAKILMKPVFSLPILHFDDSEKFCLRLIYLGLSDPSKKIISLLSDKKTFFIKNSSKSRYV